MSDLRQFLKKKTSQPSSESINFTSIESKVFAQAKDGRIYIGKELVTDQMRGLLRDQAENFLTSNLYETLSSTVTNEAFELAAQANTLEHVQYYKALIYWNKIFEKALRALAK